MQQLPCTVEGKAVSSSLFAPRFIPPVHFFLALIQLQLTALRSSIRSVAIWAYPPGGATPTAPRSSLTTCERQQHLDTPEAAVPTAAASHGAGGGGSSGQRRARRCRRARRDRDRPLRPRLAALLHMGRRHADPAVRAAGRRCGRAGAQCVDRGVVRFSVSTLSVFTTQRIARSSPFPSLHCHRRSPTA